MRRALSFKDDPIFQHLRYWSRSKDKSSSVFQLVLRRIASQRKRTVSVAGERKTTGSPIAGIRNALLSFPATSHSRAPRVDRGTARDPWIVDLLPRRDPPSAWGSRKTKLDPRDASVSRVQDVSRHPRAH